MTSTLSGTTFDAIADNISQLRQLFPEAFREDQIDFDKLKMLLSDYITSDKESYSFTRGGKRDALKLALAQTTGTLRPDRASSKDRDTTQNLYIEGDNLEVLRVLQESYRGAVKMIYIDPPYNTGKDFVYKDDFHDNVASYKEKMGENLKSNPETNGRYHTDWLNMMYPRLKLARNLLRDDGVIFMSIDDNEVHNLRKIADEIFGEENFVAQIIWQKKFSPQNDATYFSNMHDYVLCYAKKKKDTKSDLGWERILLPRNEKKSNYSNPDNDVRGDRTSGDFTAEGITPNCVYEIIAPNGKVHLPPQGKRRAYNKENYEVLKSENRFWFGKDGTAFPRIKRFYSEVQQGMVPNTIWFHEDVGHTQEGKQETNKLFERAIFDYPKPIRLLIQILKISTRNNDIILDFFSGSATTAHAVMALNAEDRGNRQYIMVQIPEMTDESSEAYKAGYHTICEIGKERIRRAGEKIKEDHKDKEGIDKLDIGFKCFTLDTTNLKKRDINPSNINESLFHYANPIIEGRSTDDMLYEIMLKKGLELTTHVETKFIGDKTIYIVGGGSLIVCLDTGITLDLIQSMIALEPEMMKGSSRSTIVLYDAGFADSVIKTNAVHQIEKAGLKLLVI